MMTSAATVFIVACGCNLLLFGFLTLISTEFVMLAKKFSELSPKTPSLKKEITDLITQHDELMKIADELQNIYSFPVFVNFFLASVWICLAGFQMIVKPSSLLNFFHYAVILKDSLLQSFILCFFAQKLIDSSASVGDGAYEMEWYSIDDLQIRKSIQLVIMRSQKPKKLTAMNFADVSLENYGVVSC